MTQWYEKMNTDTFWLGVIMLTVLTALISVALQAGGLR
jgi:hypothetical protein